jgi:hypothetical protein
VLSLLKIPTVDHCMAQQCSSVFELKDTVANNEHFAAECSNLGGPRGDIRYLPRLRDAMSTAHKPLTSISTPCLESSAAPRTKSYLPEKHSTLLSHELNQHDRDMPLCCRRCLPQGRLRGRTDFGNHPHGTHGPGSGPGLRTTSADTSTPGLKSLKTMTEYPE